MQLFGSVDHEPPVFEGPGYVDIQSPTIMQFTLFPKERPNTDAANRLQALGDDPYDTRKRFRLQAADLDGTEWSCGWTAPRLKGMPRIGFPLTGRLDSLLTLATGHWVSPHSSVELVFYPKLDLPMSSRMTTVTSVDDKEIERRISPGGHRMEVLGSQINFFYPPAEDVLWITAATSPELPHPYCENWLSEPLCILLGRLIYPRLVARNFGDRTAQVWVRPSPSRPDDWGLASLLEQHPFESDNLWSLYGMLLTYIATARDSKGDPSFEPNPLTRYYQEAIQATDGSRWVLCMTLASAVEGLVRVLATRPTGKLSVENRLKHLERRGTITSRHRLAWRTVRHAVMHGQLVSPWSTREEDARIRELIDLLRRLTYDLLQRGSRPAPP